MSEVEWISVAGKSLLYCAELLDKIKRLKELLQNSEDELTSQDGAERVTRTTWLRHGPLNWSPYYDTWIQQNYPPLKL